MHEIANRLSLPTSLYKNLQETITRLSQEGDRVKTSKRKGNRTKPIQRRPHYEVSSATSWAVFLMASSGAAFAQDAPPAARAVRRWRR